MGLDEAQLSNLAVGAGTRPAPANLRRSVVLTPGPGLFKLAHWSGPRGVGTAGRARGAEGAPAPAAADTLLVAFGSAPGVPNWAGALKRVAARDDVAPFDTLFVVDPTRAWYHGGLLRGAGTSHGEGSTSWLGRWAAWEPRVPAGMCESSCLIVCHRHPRGRRRGGAVCGAPAGCDLGVLQSGTAGRQHGRHGRPPVRAPRHRGAGLLPPGGPGAVGHPARQHRGLAARAAPAGGGGRGGVPGRSPRARGYLGARPGAGGAPGTHSVRRSHRLVLRDCVYCHHPGPAPTS